MSVEDGPEMLKVDAMVTAGAAKDVTNYNVSHNVLSEEEDDDGRLNRVLCVMEKPRG